MARTRAEQGAIGLPIMSGYLSLDPNTRLRGRKGVAIYRKLAHDEPAATSFLSAAYNLLRTDMQVEPGGSTDRDKRAAEFLGECLQDMRDALATAMRQMYSMITFGWYVGEVVYKRRSGGSGSRYEDGRVGWAAWALRRQETLERWELDKNGRISAFTQRPAPDYRIRTLPLTRCIHLVADDSEGSPEGKSALRGMYRLGYFVEQLELLEGIALERGAGYPVLERREGVPDINAAAQGDAEAFLASIRQNEEAGAAIPYGWVFRFEPMPGVDAAVYRDAIQAKRVWMLATVLSDFIALGTAGGSFALGKDKSELFLLALNGYQDRLTTTLNRQVVPKLFRYNDFGKLTDLPRLSLPAVRRYDLAGLASFTQMLNTIGALHITPQDEMLFRKISDLVDLDEKEVRALHEADMEPALGLVACPSCGYMNAPDALACEQCGASLPAADASGTQETGQDKDKVAGADTEGTDEEEVSVEDEAE